MPNHTSCLLNISGDEAAMQRLIEQVKGKTEILSFHKIVPMPESLNITAGSCSARAHEAYLWSIGEKKGMIKDYKEFGGEAESLDEFAERMTKDCDLALGKVVHDNIKNHGYPDWYEWSKDKWGTKWDAYDMSDAWHKQQDGSMEMDFMSAWSPPIAVIAALSKQYPELKIKLKFADEGQQFLGYIVWSGGEEVEDEWFEDWDSDEAKECLDGLAYSWFNEEDEDIEEDNE